MESTVIRNWDIVWQKQMKIQITSFGGWRMMLTKNMSRQQQQRVERHNNKAHPQASSMNIASIVTEVVAIVVITTKQLEPEPLRAFMIMIPIAEATFATTSAKPWVSAGEHL